MKSANADDIFFCFYKGKLSVKRQGVIFFSEADLLPQPAIILALMLFSLQFIVRKKYLIFSLITSFYRARLKSHATLFLMLFEMH